MTSKNINLSTTLGSYAVAEALAALARIKNEDLHPNLAEGVLPRLLGCNPALVEPLLLALRMELISAGFGPTRKPVVMIDAALDVREGELA